MEEAIGNVLDQLSLVENLEAEEEWDDLFVGESENKFVNAFLDKLSNITYISSKKGRELISDEAQYVANFMDVVAQLAQEGITGEAALHRIFG